MPFYTCRWRYYNLTTETLKSGEHAHQYLKVLALGCQDSGREQGCVCRRGSNVQTRVSVTD